MDENKKIEREIVSIRSEVVQEIMSSVPHVLIRWGNTIILFLSFGVLAFSYFIHYPVVLRGQAEMKAGKESIEIYAPIAGMLSRLTFENAELVEKDIVIAQVNSANGSRREIISPKSGRLYATSFFVGDDIVQKGDLLFRLLSKDSLDYQAIVKIPSSALNRISLGQEVRLRFSNNETQQNIINGNIAEVSQVADEDGLVAIQVLFSTRKSIGSDNDFLYLPGMKGVAEIIVENPRLIDHLFLQLRNILNS